MVNHENAISQYFAKKADEGADILCENGTITLETIILKLSRPSFFDKAGCTRQFESELSLRSLAPLFPINQGIFDSPVPLLRRGDP